MKVLHLIYVHGFQGNDTTFQSFPSDLQAYLTERIPARFGIEVRSSLYPTYKSVKPIAHATRNFLEWLNTQPPGPVILLGHSMGGLLVADAATHLSNNPSAYPGAKPSRIVGVIAFDTPYLGMHPHVVVSGIASLLPKNKEKGKGKGKDKDGKDKDKGQGQSQADQDDKHNRAEKAMNPGVTIVDRNVTDEWDGVKRDAEHKLQYSVTPHHSRPSSIMSESDNQSFYSATSSRPPSPKLSPSPPSLPTRPPKFPSASTSSLAPPFPIPSPYVAPTSPTPSTLTPPPRLPPRPLARPSSPSTVASYRSTSPSGPSSPALSQLSPSFPSSPSTLTSPRSRSPSPVPFKDKALSFLSAHSNDPIVKWARKHADDPLKASIASSETWLLNQQTLLVEQFQFGACMFDPSGLTARYRSLVAWRGKGGMWVNYWTETRPDVRGEEEEKKIKKWQEKERHGEVEVGEDHGGIRDHKESMESEAREDSDSLGQGSDDVGLSEHIPGEHKLEEHLEEQEDKDEREDDQVETEDTNTDPPDATNKDEAKRLKEEAKRVKAEEKRMKAEEKRLKADEEKRVKDEQKRAKDEQKRIKDAEKLVKAEEKRAKAEQKAEQKAEAKRANKLHKDPHPPHGRHFIVLPTGWGQYLGGTSQWEKVVIAGVEDEVAAHTGLFIRGQNLEYERLVERVGERVLGFCEAI